jgi:methanogenic corrinoid protein MtbC1
MTFYNLLKTLIIKKGLLATTTEIIYPFLHQVGVLWGMNKVMPAQEHFITNLIRKRILSIIDAMPHPRENAASIIMFLPEREYHEMGLLLAYYIAREIGWRVYYLGQDVPTDNLTEVINQVKPNALLAMFVTPATNRLSVMIDNILSQGNVKLYVSGNPDNFTNFLSNKEVTYLLNPNHLIKELEKFQKE